jgi:photosystem II stability/assembly factor-like uncharacterized protein
MKIKTLISFTFIIVTYLISNNLSAQYFANFNYPEVACKNTPIEFINTSSGNFSNWEWHFGEGGSILYSENPTYSYNNSGTFDIMLVASNPDSMIYDTVINTITIFETPYLTSLNVSDVSCFGGNDGSATVTASGGNGTIYFEWQDMFGTPIIDETNSFINNLTPGIYNIHLLDDNDCSFLQDFEIMEPSQILANLTSFSVSCIGNDGAATSDPSGGVPPYSYLWSNFTTDFSLVGADTGSYSITITDNNGCVIEDVVYIGNQVVPYPWTAQSSNISETSSFARFSIVDENVIWAAANNSGIYTKTTNGGNTWVEGSIPNANSDWFFVDIYAFDSNNAFMLFANQSIGGGYLYKTTDGGTNWSSDTSVFKTSNSWPNGIHFYDQNNGVMFGDPEDGYMEIYTTTDGGTSWQRVSSGNIPAPQGGEYGFSRAFDAVGNKIWFTTNQGRVYYSNDKGLNWNVSVATPGEAISNIAFKNENTGILHSDNWTRMITNDGGATWNSFTNSGPLHWTWTTTKDADAIYVSYNFDWGASYSLDGETWTQIDDYNHNTIAFKSRSLGFSGRQNVISCDGIGKIDPNYFPAAGCDLITNTFENPSSCANRPDGTVGVNVSNGTPPYLYSWVSYEYSGTPINGLPTTASFDAYTFGDQLYIVTVVDNNGCEAIDSVMLYHSGFWGINSTVTDADCSGQLGSIDVTFNGGVAPIIFNWSNGETTLNISNLNAETYTLTISDANNCEAIVTKTVAEGYPDPWSQIASGLTANETIARYSIVDRDIIWAMTDNNGKFLKSTDGGNTWMINTIPNVTSNHYFADIYASSSSNAIVVYANSSTGGSFIYKTTDGGNSWQNITGIYTSSSSWPNGIHFFDQNNGIMIGDPESGYMEIYTTSDAGNTWNRVSNTNIPAAQGGEYGTIRAYHSVGNSFWFPTNQGRVFYSSNRGLNWNVSNATPGESITNIVFKNENEGILHSDSWTRMSTNDGGATWNPLFTSGPLHWFWTTTNDEDAIYISYSPGWGFTYSNDGANWIDVDSYSHNTIAFKSRSLGFSGQADVLSCGGIGKINPDFFPTTCNLQANTTSANASCFSLANGSAEITVSNGVAPYKYSWSNGLNASSNSNLAASNYTVTITDVANCTITQNITITQPNIISITPDVTNSTCGNNNGAITVAISGGTGSGYSLVWGNGDTVLTRTNLTSGSYFVTVFNGGCSRSLQIPVGDSDGPTVSVSSVVDANCGGADGEVYISVTGGNTPYAYTWSNGVTAQNLLNAEPGYVGVVVADANGCAGSASATIGSNGNTPPTLKGKVKLTQNGFTVTGGKVQVVRENPYANAMVVVAETNIQPDGNYFINSVLPIGDYLLIARPDTSIPSLKYAIPTYFEITHKWEDATQVGAMCDMVITNDIEVINLLLLNGASTISGTIFADGGNKNFGRAGDPIPGIDISLEQIPGGIIANTQTNDEGEYKFDNVPVSSNKYTVYVGIPGLPMAESYIVEIGSDTVVNNLNFLVGESQIYIETISSIESKIAENNSLYVYPNPFKGQTNIVYEVIQSENVAVEIYNILGKKIHAQNFGVQPKGKYAYNFQSSNLTSGMYVVKLITGNNTQTQRVVAFE